MVIGTHPGAAKNTSIFANFEDLAILQLGNEVRASTHDQRFVLGHVETNPGVGASGKARVSPLSSKALGRGCHGRAQYFDHDQHVNRRTTRPDPNVDPRLAEWCAILFLLTLNGMNASCMQAGCRYLPGSKHSQIYRIEPN